MVDGGDDGRYAHLKRMRVCGAPRLSNPRIAGPSSMAQEMRSKRFRRGWHSQVIVRE